MILSGGDSHPGWIEPGSTITHHLPAPRLGALLPASTRAREPPALPTSLGPSPSSMPCLHGGNGFPCVALMTFMSTSRTNVRMLNSLPSSNKQASKQTNTKIYLPLATLYSSLTVRLLESFASTRHLYSPLALLPLQSDLVSTSPQSLHWSPRC